MQHGPKSGGQQRRDLRERGLPDHRSNFSPLEATEAISYGIDSMTMSAPRTWVNFGGANQPKGPGESEEESWLLITPSTDPDNPDCRIRLLPQVMTPMPRRR